MKKNQLLHFAHLKAVIGLASMMLATQHAVIAAPSLSIERHKPYNLFEPTQNVTFNVRHKEIPADAGTATGVLRDYDGRVAWKGEVTLKAGEPATLDLGRLPRGYYELTLTAAGKEAKATFGVMEFVNRTAKEVRDGNYVFGMKWWAGVANHAEGMEAMSKLGLQWTRIIQNERGQLGIKSMLTDYPMNAVIKIERFPKELYDTERYGPIEEYEKKYGRGVWVLKTLPKKEPYQAWLRQQLAENVPPDQNVFEIWNEPWDKMSPEDFATLSNWIAEVVLQERPNAILGQNLHGTTSPFEYDARVIKAGGLKGMKMVALHPYGNAGNREWLREYMEWLKKETGTDMELYITEYGSHSTPAGPNRRSEQEQARRVVLQSLALYAEGAKALIPHWLGQTERDPSYIEDWFGFVRKNENPKPALMAHANTARLIDGSKYLGDLWFGPHVGAMLFDNKSTHVLALWVGGEVAESGEPITAKEIEVRPGTTEVVVVDIVGREKKLPVTDGVLKLQLTQEPLYLVGVSPQLAAQASKELRADRWPQPARPARVTRVAKRLTVPPTLDGKFNDWAGTTEIGLVNPKVNGADASGIAYVGWDDRNLYLGFDIRDNEMLNTRPRGKMYQQDSIELFVSTVPRDSGAGFGPDDYQFFITPTSAENKPILGVLTDREAGVVPDVPGGRIFAGKTARPEAGWAMEAAIPWSTFGNFKPAPGAKLALEMRFNDADTSHERFKIDPSDLPGQTLVKDPSSWSLLVLNE